MVKTKSLLWPLVMTVPAVIILLMMGFWQLDRLAWKEALIADLDAARHADPVLLPAAPEGISDLDFRPVHMRGRYLEGKQVHLQNRNHDSIRGVEIIAAFSRDSSEGGGIVLVNRGWVPLKQLDALALPAQGQTGSVTVSGIVRAGAYGRNAFTPDNDAEKSLWYSVDPVAMAQSMGLETQPLIVEINQTVADGTFPAPGLNHYEPKNNHLSYAVTWFSLAAGLVVIFGLFARQRFRDSR